MTAKGQPSKYLAVVDIRSVLPDQGLDSAARAAAASASGTESVLVWYLGLQVPQQAFLDRWGSYWATILGHVCLPVAATIATAIAGGLMNDWALLVLVPISLMALATAVLQPHDVLLPFSTLQDKHNMEVQIRTFGKPVAYLRTVLQAVQAIAVSVWHVTIFLYPPFNHQVFATALMAFQDGINVPVLIAGEVPRSQRHWLTSRLARIIIVIGSYLEFGSDFAAGITSIKRGKLALGIPITLAGVIEFFLTNHILTAGIYEHSRRTIWVHAALEVPVAVLSILSIVNSHLPLRAQSSFLASLVMSVCSIAGNLLWLYVMKPHFLRRAAVHPAPVEAPGDCGLDG